MSMSAIDHSKFQTHIFRLDHFSHFFNLVHLFSWKDPNCPFRKDPRTHLVFLPTLLRWKSPQRLDGSQCSDPELVEMLFTDDD